MILHLSEFYLFIYLFVYLFIYSLIHLFIYLFIYLFTYLFYLYIRYLSEIYLSKVYQVICLRMFYILWFTNTIVLSFRYIVNRKEQSKTRGKIREEIGREYDQMSQIIKKKCYL